MGIKNNCLLNTLTQIIIFFSLPTERPFAVVKGTKHKNPSMTHRNAKEMASARVNHTFAPCSPPGKTEKTQNKTGKKSRDNGLNFHTTPPPLKAAIFALHKETAKERKEEYDADCAEQMAVEEQRINDQRDARRVTATNKAEKQNYMSEVTLIQCGQALDAKLESKKCDGDREKLLKDQIHARCSKGRNFDYRGLTSEYQNTRGTDPKLSVNSGGVKALVEYLTRLVKELIRIDVEEGRYESDAMEMELEMKLYRSIPSVGTMCALGIQLEANIEEEEGEALEKSVQDDPDLLRLESLFKDRKFIDEDLANSPGFLCLGIQFNPDFDRWVAECVQLDNKGEVPRSSKTRKSIIKDTAKVDYGLSIEEQSAMTRGIAAYGALYGPMSSS